MRGTPLVFSDVWQVKGVRQPGCRQRTARGKEGCLCCGILLPGVRSTRCGRQRLETADGDGRCAKMPEDAKEPTSSHHSRERSRRKIDVWGTRQTRLHIW